MANYYNVFVRATNRTIVPWTVVTVELSMSFKDLFIQIKSGIFSTISTSLELSSSMLNAVYIGQDKSTANSLVDGKVNILSVCTLFGWHVRFVVTFVVS